ncbi:MULTISPECIES: 3'-5' exonuclease [unclassified Brevibacillus]|uniref:3'-5' exonuclease n=1 Tax=unclassified Brevibacillus TaxID=2684853 RepID=UPI0035620BBA
MSNLELFKGRVVCPLCLGNGLIYKAKVVDEIVYVCDECDAFWSNPREINAEIFGHFPNFLKKKGVSYVMSNFEGLFYDWYKA